MKRAILTVSPEFIREMLQLPEGCIIIRIESPISRPGVLELSVEGAGWEVKEGEYIPRTIGTVTMSEDGTKVVDWGFDREAFFTGTMK